MILWGLIIKLDRDYSRYRGGIKMITVSDKVSNLISHYDYDGVSITFNSEGELELKITREDSENEIRIELDEEVSNKLINFCQDKINHVVPF